MTHQQARCYKRLMPDILAFMANHPEGHKGETFWHSVIYGPSSRWTQGDVFFFYIIQLDTRGCVFLQSVIYGPSSNWTKEGDLFDILWLIANHPAGHKGQIFWHSVIYGPSSSWTQGEAFFLQSVIYGPASRWSLEGDDIMWFITHYPAGHKWGNFWHGGGVTVCDLWPIVPLYTRRKILTFCDLCSAEHGKGVIFDNLWTMVNQLHLQYLREGSGLHAEQVTWLV